jgi:mannose-1-phosphate guanylyltransferase
MHAVILAGGKGIRLRPYTTSLPKPLVPIGDEYSILEIVMRQLASRGFTSATLAIGHLGHLIRAYVQDGERWGIRVDYAIEESPLGTIGPLLPLLDTLPEDFLVMNGDVLTDIDYGDVLGKHRASGAPLTVATYQRDVKIDFGVLTTQGGRITEFTEKPTIDYHVSMGVYALSRETLRRYTVGLPLGFDELVLDLLASGDNPHEYPFQGHWLDIGRPDDYDQANAEFPILRPLLLPDLEVSGAMR